MNSPGQPYGKPQQEYPLEAAADWTRRKLNIDDDRVYLFGWGAGGCAVWNLAALQPQRFAAAVSWGALPAFDGFPFTSTMYLGNLQPLGFWASWPAEADASTRDLCQRVAAEAAQKHVDFRSQELRDADNDPEAAALLAFFHDHRRTAAPAVFHHAFHQQRHSRGYYVDVVEPAHEPFPFAGKIIAKFPPRPMDAPPPTQEEKLRAIEQEIGKYLISFHATRDIAAGQVKIVGKAIRTVRVRLLTGVFDLSHPVTITFLSHTFQGPVAASARCILEHYAETRDQANLVENVVQINITGQAAVLYE
jgi:dienelactone hydrolase